MVKIEEHEAKLKQAIIDRDNATGYRRKDLDRYVKRLKKELAECKRYIKK